MPPKKRARVSQAASPAATDQQHKTPTPAAQSPSKADEDILNDPWTDEEAIGLFKAVIKWKPTGKSSLFQLPIIVFRLTTRRKAYTNTSACSKSVNTY
jgi:MRG-binding protein